MRMVLPTNVRPKIVAGAPNCHGASIRTTPEASLGTLPVADAVPSPGVDLEPLLSWIWDSL